MSCCGILDVDGNTQRWQSTGSDRIWDGFQSGRNYLKEIPVRLIQNWGQIRSDPVPNYISKIQIPVRSLIFRKESGPVINPTGIPVGFRCSSCNGLKALKHLILAVPVTV